MELVFKTEIENQKKAIELENEKRLDGIVQHRIEKQLADLAVDLDRDRAQLDKERNEFIESQEELARSTLVNEEARIAERNSELTKLQNEALIKEAAAEKAEQAAREATASVDALILERNNLNEKINELNQELEHSRDLEAQTRVVFSSNVHAIKNNFHPFFVFLMEILMETSIESHIHYVTHQFIVRFSHPRNRPKSWPRQSQKKMLSLRKTKPPFKRIINVLSII